MQTHFYFLCLASMRNLTYLTQIYALSLLSCLLQVVSGCVMARRWDETWMWPHCPLADGTGTAPLTFPQIYNLRLLYKTKGRWCLQTILGFQCHYMYFLALLWLLSPDWVRRVSWCCESGRCTFIHGFFTTPGSVHTTDCSPRGNATSCVDYSFSA